MKDYWIKKLDMLPHPEGGYYKEVFKSKDLIKPEGLSDRYSGSRSAGTSIYFLLNGDNFSAFHRLQSDEIWHFYTGSSLTVYVINNDGELIEQKIGPNYEEGEVFQYVVPSNLWFASKCNDPEGYSLVGCTVSPGFEFEDFEMAKREDLVREFPQYESVIAALTRT